VADYIPFITGEDSGNLVRKVYSDAEFVRVPLDRADKVRHLVPSTSKVWLDPCVDGMDDVETRRSQSDKKNSWFDFMSGFANFEKIGTPAYYAKPDTSEVYSFVKAVMDKCAAYRPAWITVPQFPLVSGSDRNRINRAMAEATGKWGSSSGFSGRLILPLLFTHQDQVNRKTARNSKVQQAARCYRDAQADGLWVVDMSLTDDNGSSTLRNKRFPGVIDLHEELNVHISSKIRIAGPYWGLNLVLWARGLADHPAIGIGSGYQYFLAGRPYGRQPSTKLALPSLRRRVGIGRPFKNWLDQAIAKLGPTHPTHGEYSGIRKNYTVLSESDRAREQVAVFYKQWFGVIAAAPKAGRSMALFQDLSAAYALGKSLPDLADEGTARRPEAVAEPLMLSCL
jgi:hypothetical protein